MSFINENKKNKQQILMIRQDKQQEMKILTNKDDFVTLIMFA